MSGYYNDLTFDEQQKVLSAMVGLKLNLNSGKPVTRQDINAAFMQATGKQLSIEYMRDPSVVQLMGLVSEGRASTGAFKSDPRINKKPDPVTTMTDRNLAARGLPVPSRAPSIPGATRYSAGAVGNSRYGR